MAFSSPRYTFLLKDVPLHRQHLQDLEPVSQKFEPPEETRVVHVPRIEELAISSEKTCATCGVEFQSRGSQVEHYKSDWHRFNIKAKLSNERILSEEQFETIGSDCESISATDSESEENVEISHDAGKLLFMNSRQDVIEINRVLIGTKSESLTEAELMSRVHSILGNNLRMALIMIAGGHFAAAIIHDGKILESKTFHAYTCRANQGGSQSTKNNQGNAPHSAGASLRLHNEISLAQKARNCLSSWTEQLQLCDLILYRALRANRDILFGGKIPVFMKSDPRVRPMSLITRRPTLRELLRVHDYVTTVVVVKNPAEYYAKRIGPAVKKEKPKKAANSKTQSKILTHEDSDSDEIPQIPRKKPSVKKPLQQATTAAKRELHEELFLACTDDDLEKFETILERTRQEDLPDVFSRPIDESRNTVLHLCCRRGRLEMLKRILEMRPDLTATNKERQTPYSVALNNSVRQLFIDYRLSHPAFLDYAKAGIPERLTEPKVSKKKPVSSAKNCRAARGAPKPAICDSCQKEFTAMPLTADDKKFCSVNCVRLWRFSSS